MQDRIRDTPGLNRSLPLLEPLIRLLSDLAICRGVVQSVQSLQQAICCILHDSNSRGHVIAELSGH